MSANTIVTIRLQLAIIQEAIKLLQEGIIYMDEFEVIVGDTFATISKLIPNSKYVLFERETHDALYRHISDIT
jgi:hypothetical protein